MITLEQFNKIVHKGKPEVYVNALNMTFEKYKIDTKLRQCHFLAQMLHETMNLIYLKELASGQAYEFRKDLGNKMPGHGVKYKGRGGFMLTGYENYLEYSKHAGIDAINKPEMLEQLPHAFLSAGWFWRNKGLNILADANDILEISKRINGVNKKTGMPNHYNERCEKYNICESILK